MTAPLITRTEALELGMSAQEIDALVRCGQWTPVRRGVYAETELLPDDAVTRHAVEVAAAAAATRLDVVGSHESGAVLHQLATFTRYTGPPVLSRCRDRGKDRPIGATPAPLVSHVPAEHRMEILAAPVTTPARTAIDLARKGPALSAVVVLDAALRAGVSREQLRDVLRVARGWPGSVKAAAFVAFADGRAESALESVGRWRMHQLELPVPDLQRTLFDGGRFLGRADFYFEEFRTIGEADGLAKYRDDDGRPDPEVLELEKNREDGFRDAGHEVFRFTWDIAVHRPAELERRALRAFERARRRRAA